jgi:hypothetical protein
MSVLSQALYSISNMLRLRVHDRLAGVPWWLREGRLRLIAGYNVRSAPTEALNNARRSPHTSSSERCNLVTLRLNLVRSRICNDCRRVIPNCPRAVYIVDVRGGPYSGPAEEATTL